MINQRASAGRRACSLPQRPRSRGRVAVAHRAPGERLSI